MKKETTIMSLAVLALAFMGLLTVYSVDAVSFTGENNFTKHVVYLLIGLAAFVALSQTDYHALGDHRWFKWIIISAVVLLLLVIIPGIGHEAGGARRWLRLFGLSFQPSEYAKLALVVLLAVKLTQNHNNIESLVKGLAPPALIAVVFSGLVGLERDIGIPAVMLTTAFVMIFVAGMRWFYLGLAAVGGVGLLVAGVVFAPHRMGRILALIDPWAYRQGIGWQLIQSLSAFAQGGLLGRGAGAGEQKLGYLPAAHTDFIFATIGEELGLAGTTAVLLLFVLFTWAAIRVAVNSTDMFGALLATGITVLISFQGAFIMAVNVGILPTKGLPLPFVSYGGTALVMFMAMAGILVSIGSHARANAPAARVHIVSMDRRRRARNAVPVAGGE